MTRRTKVVTIEEENRDHGKQFLLTEMDAETGEWWAFRVLQSLLAANPDIGNMQKIDFSNQASMAKLAAQGFAAIGKIGRNEAKELLDEMMQCVRVQLPDGQTSRALLKTDIEEISTRLKLRAEVFQLHAGFFAIGSA